MDAKKDDITMLSKKQTALKNLYALSPAQENILHYMLQTTDNTAYLEQLTFHITGELDAQLMHASWQTLTNHYDILRTIFVHKGLQPLQMALDHVDVEFRFTDIQRLTPQEQQDYLQTFKQQDRNQGFNLYQDILSRVNLFQLDNQHFVMMWTYHAILLDNHCSHILQQALNQIYQSLKNDKTPQLTNIAPYHHYTDWLNQQIPHDSHQYWQHYLHDYQTICSVPSDAASEQNQAAQYNVTIPRSTAQQLFDLAKQKSSPVNTLLKTAWGYLLCYYNDCQDVVFGATTQLACEQFNAVGLLNNIIPIRVNTQQTAYFDQLLDKIHQDVQSHQQHIYYSFANIQQNLQFPLIDHILCFEQPALTSQHDSIRMELTEHFKHSGFELVVSLTPTPDSIQVQFAYHTNVYSHEQIQRVAQHFMQILQTVAAQPHIPLSAIHPLTQADIQQLLFDFNPQYHNEKWQCGLVELLTHQAQQQAHKPALICADETLTYTELNQKSNQVAHYLINQGIVTDDCVAICMENSVYLGVALWGVLKAGAAYTFCQQHHKIKQVLTLDNIQTILTTTSNIEPPNISIQPDDLVYLSDNGVMVEQSNLVHFCTNLTVTFHWHHNDVVYSTVTDSDMAALSLIGGLMFGVTLVLPDSQQLTHRLQQHQVSILQTSPQTLQTLITTQGLAPLHDLSIIMLNGDRLTPTLYAQLQRVDNLLVFDLVDNPETTLASYAQCLQSEMDDLTLNEEAIYIISKQNALLPVGAVGEIAIGGAGVSRGYIDKPELTSEKFIKPDFLSQQIHTRLYKTGYIGRRLGDGRIERLGKM